MPRISQSSLLPFGKVEFLDLLCADTQRVALAAQVPTLSFQVKRVDGEPRFVQHNLVFGLFRTSWQSRVSRWDLEIGLFVSELPEGLLAGFRHAMRLEESNGGLLVHDELAWDSVRPSLGDLLMRSVVRHPHPATAMPAFAERPTTRFPSISGQQAA